jgi:hypothetical protein
MSQDISASLLAMIAAVRIEVTAQTQFRRRPTQAVTASSLGVGQPVARMNSAVAKRRCIYSVKSALSSIWHPTGLESFYAPRRRQERRRSEIIM